MEQIPGSHLRFELQAVAERATADRARLEALIDRVDALGVPIDRKHVQEEIDLMAALLQSVVERVAALEAHCGLGTTAPRARGVIGALRTERPGPDEEQSTD